MSYKTSDMEYTILGELLRETRIRQGFDLQAIAEDTRITYKNLLAMEESNFSALPAEVYTRGYYSLYAKSLSLNPDEVLAMYGRERKNQPKESGYKTPPPNRLAQNMKNLADPPSSLPLAYFGLAILLLLLFGAFLCWYFSWNPASYLSGKLRSFDQPPRIEEAKERNKGSETRGEDTLTNQAITMKQEPLNLINLSSPALATAATTQPEPRKDSAIAVDTAKYHVNATFAETTKLSLKIDNNPQRTLTFKTGELVSWRATEKLIITLPAKTQTRLSLNDVPLQLPKTDKEYITLSIPESLSQ